MKIRRDWTTAVIILLTCSVAIIASADQGSPAERRLVFEKKLDDNRLLTGTWVSGRGPAGAGAYATCVLHLTDRRTNRVVELTRAIKLDSDQPIGVLDALATEKRWVAVFSVGKATHLRAGSVPSEQPAADIGQNLPEDRARLVYPLPGSDPSFVQLGFETQTAKVRQDGDGEVFVSELQFSNGTTARYLCFFSENKASWWQPAQWLAPAPPEVFPGRAISNPERRP